MTTPSINQLKEINDSLKKSIRKLKKSEFGDTKYGSENEYSAGGVIAGLNAIAIDLSALI